MCSSTHVNNERIQSRISRRVVQTVSFAAVQHFFFFSVQPRMGSGSWYLLLVFMFLFCIHSSCDRWILVVRWQLRPFAAETYTIAHRIGHRALAIYLFVSSSPLFVRLEWFRLHFHWFTTVCANVPSCVPSLFTRRLRVQKIVNVIECAWRYNAAQQTNNKIILDVRQTHTAADSNRDRDCVCVWRAVECNWLVQRLTTRATIQFNWMKLLAIIVCIVWIHSPAVVWRQPTETDCIRSRTYAIGMGTQRPIKSASILSFTVILCF